MATVAQPRLSDILSAPFSVSSQCSFELPEAVCYGEVSSGGLVASVIAKYSVFYASQNPKTRSQTEIRSAHVQFYRPLFPRNGPVTMDLREVSIGRAWSTLRVEMFQGSKKIAASADVLISNFSFPGQTLETGWKLSPPLRDVNLDSLSNDGDPSWACYHTAFNPSGYRRADSYVKNYIPTNWPQELKYVEQWITPGWDCIPLGSRDAAQKEALWTDDIIPFVADMNLPVQENFGVSKTGQKPPLGSIAATLQFAAAQKKARSEGNPNWRELPDDGQEVAMYANSFVNVTLSLSFEIKKRLPLKGTRWLCLRSEIKRVQEGRMDLEVLIFDQSMELVAISHQVGQIIRPVDKTRRKASL